MRKVGIMQPYFFPYIGYFSLLKHVDEFVLFDPVQFIRHGWIERNRILKQGEGWLYIKVPLVKHPHQTPIKDIQVDNAQNWKRTLLAQLGIYKKRARYFDPVYRLIENSLKQEHSSIVEINRATIHAVCHYLEIATPLSVFSEMDLPMEEPHAADEWALNICKAMGNVDEYWNPPGGQSFFDSAKYDDAGIVLRFHQPRMQPYDQKRAPFEPGLSIIDVLMFNSPETVNRMLDDYEFL